MINLHDTARKITALFLYFTIVVFFLSCVSLVPLWAYTYGIYFEDMSLRFLFIESIILLLGLTYC